MSLLADALQPFIRNEFLSISGRPDSEVLTDIIVAPKIGYDLDFDAEKKSISMDFWDAHPVISALAADCCRFSTSSFQTISLTVNEILDRDNVAWSIVKLYYSAFYAGHAILRLCGEFCSYFDREHVRRIRELANTVGTPPPFLIDVGLYKCVLTRGTAVLQCHKAKGAAGGIHELFWEIFGNTIKVISEQTLLGPLVREDAQKAYIQLDRFRAVLQKDGAHKWLSYIRNELQYRHKYQVWFPSNPRSKDKERFSRLITRWTKDPMEIELGNSRPELETFVSCCTFLVALCRVLIERVADRSSAGEKCFITLGPTVFLKDRQFTESRRHD